MSKKRIVQFSASSGKKEIPTECLFPKVADIFNYFPQRLDVISKRYVFVLKKVHGNNEYLEVVELGLGLHISFISRQLIWKFGKFGVRSSPFTFERQQEIIWDEASNYQM